MILPPSHRLGRTNGLEVITDAEGFRRAFNSAYVTLFDSLILVGKGKAYNPAVEIIYQQMHVPVNSLKPNNILV